MKQFDLFGNEFTESDKEEKYTKKIKVPIYEPKNKKPHILELCDKSKTHRLLNEIQRATNVTIEEKNFLIDAASRHNVFDYSKIADYYAHATKEMQQLMEHSALVIIDFNKAYQYGYIKLAHDVANQYFDNYEE